MISPELLIKAYANGLFPMAHSMTGQIEWHRPTKRAIIPLDNRFRVSKSLQRKYRQQPFRLTINRNFPAVIKACRQLRVHETWISEEIVESYIELNKMRYAHSFEAWLDDELVGGLYGIAMGKAFFGESMFHTQTDASKICLVYLVEHLRKHDFKLLDTQYINPHTAQFGAYEISDRKYMELLSVALGN